MTGKQRAMIAERLKDNTAPNHEIIRRAGYGARNNHTRAQQYLENMKKPEIRTQLDNVVEEMETVLTDTVRRYKDSDKLPEVVLANDNAKWIHDKVKGKATQRIEQQTTGVTLTIDLSGTQAMITPQTDQNTAPKQVQ